MHRMLGTKHMATITRTPVYVDRVATAVFVSAALRPDDLCQTCSYMSRLLLGRLHLKNISFPCHPPPGRPPLDLPVPALLTKALVATAAAMMAVVTMEVMCGPAVLRPLRAPG